MPAPSPTCRAAAARIAGAVHRTPVMTSETLDRAAGRRVFVKCENLQKTGAFKYRGATNAVRNLPASLAARGVVTHSSGNHAQALALAARVRGIPAYIVIPSNCAGGEESRGRRLRRHRDFVRTDARRRARKPPRNSSRKPGGR